MPRFGGGLRPLTLSIGDRLERFRLPGGPFALAQDRQLVGLRGVVAFVTAVGVFADKPLTGDVDESLALGDRRAHV